MHGRVIECQRLNIPALDGDGFRRRFERVAVGGSRLPRRDGDSGRQVAENNPPVGVRHELAAVLPKRGSFAVGDVERRARNGIRRTRRVLLNYQSLLRTVEEGYRLRIVRLHGDGFRPGVRVNRIAGNRVFLGYDNRSDYAADTDFSVFVREVLAFAGSLSVVVGDGLAVRVHNLELDSGKRLTRFAVLLENDKIALFPVAEGHFQHVGVGNRRGFRRSVEDVSGHSFGFAYRNRHARFEILNPDFAVGVRVIRPVSDRRAASVRDFKLHAGERLVVRAVNIFANDKRTERLVVEYQRVSV